MDNIDKQHLKKKCNTLQYGAPFRFFSQKIPCFSGKKKLT